MTQDWHDVLPKIWHFLPNFGLSLLIFLLFWLGGNVVKWLVTRVGSIGNKDRQYAFSIIARFCKITLIVVGAITALGTMGVDVRALVAGLGLTGFALGFAFKDMISNILAGIIILLHRPFKKGDEIQISSNKGRVTRIDLRYTALKADDQTILIPNSKMLTDIVVVFS